jgi:hypothetical protein
MPTLPFPLPRRSIWVADLLTIEELFEELYSQRVIDRPTYIRYLAWRASGQNLAEEVLLSIADRIIPEWPAGQEPGDEPEI